MDRRFEEIVENKADYISVCVGVAEWTLSDGRFVMEKDYRVDGEIWRVNKYDADPLPSRPHAHCIEGAVRFVGCKLHLGTAELYSPKNKPLGRYLYQKQFERLISLIRPKFPGLVLPLPT
jgi:hypothetical protein